ncbi:acyltransferase, partial [Streptomyces sp. NPDC048516]
AAPAASPADVVHGPRRTPGYAPDSLVSTITDRVQEAIRDAEGDIEEAQKALIKTAIPDVMELFRRSRVGGRYEHSEFPPTDDVLKKKSQKGADQIWEGRPKWRNEKLFKSPDPLQVSVLDMNAAYLSGMKCWLPIGRLIEDTSGVHNPKKSGVHLIAPPEWDNADLPNPMGSRKEPGDVWVPEELLRTLIWAADQGLCEHPVIRKSLVSGATENLLEKLRRALVQARETAIEEGNEIAVEYVKAMYSKFVSTIGESSANRDLRRPDWMHNIRAKATGNLIRKADKARSCGLLVVQVSGTDELHVVGDWRNAVLANGKPAFPEGRGLNEVKEKKDHAYTIGGGK